MHPPNIGRTACEEEQRQQRELFFRQLSMLAVAVNQCGLRPFDDSGRSVQAAPWAETLAKISASTRHAVAVNLDPASTILDTCLKIDSTLAKVRSIAA